MMGVEPGQGQAMPTARRPLKDVFLDALAVEPETRDAWLDGECVGDPQLRRQVELMLAAHDRPQSLIDRVAPLAGPLGPATEGPGTVIGPYMLLQPIGEGGMGAVWMAEQTRPVQRKVALKIIKPGMDSTQVVARFEAERQALALMDHPNIARVLDGGATTDGRPYFAMELVKGAPITRYCDEHRLTPRERLELFADVCRAVQHAHQKGIIHRDLKPSNVLVAPYDGRPVVKVIDFGVAKAAGQRLTDRTLFTEFGAVVGTLEYMSPEQAELNNQDIDTRSDIYSLGVLLYELLTGTTPLDRSQMKQAVFAEMLRMIREVEPPRPSTRLSESKGTLPSISAQRQTEPARLAKLVRGELDWIVMKALEKDRGRRYETANGLARDVERYLADEPVQACPASAGYRFRKFARRNKAGLAVAALVLVFIVLLGGGVGWFVRDRSARQAEAAARIDSALDETARLRDQKNWPEARAAAQRADVLLAGGEGHPDLQHRFLDLVRDLDMVDRLEQVQDGQLMERDGFWEHVGAHAAYEAAFRTYGIDVWSLDAAAAADRARASAIVEQLVPALDDWAWVSRNNARHRERVRAVVCLADPAPWRVRFRDPAVQRDRVALEELAGRPEAATQPPSIARYLGQALHEAGATAKAIEVMGAAQRRHPEHFWLNVHLAAILRWRTRPPRYDEAVGYSRAAVAVRPRSPRAHLELGGSLLRPGREDEAIAAFRRALELQPGYAHPHSSIGTALAMKGAWAEAIQSYQTCLRGEVSPRLAATVHRHLGAAYLATNDWGRAIACWKTAVEIDPRRTDVHGNLAWVLATAPDPKWRDLQAAVAHARAAKDLAPNSPNNWSNLGVALLRIGDAAAAVEALETADRMLRSGDHPHRFFLAMAYWQVGEKEKARTAYEQGGRWMDKNQPANEEQRRFRAEANAVLSAGQK
jgi:serine/threonine protein kinase/Flp pilus assembly protein TadD